MIRTLISKDLRRAWRNPYPWLLNIALPLCITALVGMVFGGGGGGENNLGRIKFAIVDEDNSILSQFLRGSANQEKAAQYLEPVFLDRAAATKELNDAKLSAMLVIPAHFTSNYLTGRNVELELVKNPAEQIHPAVLEELLGVAVTGLNALSRNFLSEFPTWRRLVEGRPDYHEIAQVIETTGNKFHSVREYLFPPLVGYTNITVEATPAPAQKGATGGQSAAPAQKFNLFGYLLPGMTAMFLLFLANQGMADLHREVARRTFERYHTLHEDLFPFIAGKALFSIVIVSIGAAILLGGRGLIFRIAWPRPLQLALVTISYACFATGFIAVLVAFASSERHADALNNVITMVFSIAGGCMFPPEQLPAAMRNYISPLMPTYWYATAARGLWWSDASWGMATVKLFALAALFLGLAAFLFRRRLEKGIRE